MHVGDDLHVVQLHFLGDGAAGSRIGGQRVFLAQTFHLLVARPAGAALLAIGLEEGRHQRVEQVGHRPVGQEHVPATLRGRTLLGDKAGDHALPVHRLGWDAKRREWFEWGVTGAGDQFDWCRMAVDRTSPTFERLAGLPGELLDVLPDGFSTEVCPTAEQWWRDAALGLRNGWLMTQDYGQGSAEFFSPHRAAGTLRAYRKHRLCENLLANAGEQDLTAHVNFEEIQLAGESAGLKTELFTTQASFLGAIMQRFWPEAENHGLWVGGRGREFQTLVHPEHLGRAFHVLVQAR